MRIIEFGNQRALNSAREGDNFREPDSFDHRRHSATGKAILAWCTIGAQRVHTS